MRTQFLPSAAKITPEPIAFPSEMLVSEAKKRLSRNLFAVEHQEIRPENRAHSKDDRFCPFARWVVAFLSCEGGCVCL